MRFVMLLLVAALIACVGLFAWKTFSLDAEVSVAGAEEPSSPQITFRDENGVFITASEDFLLGREKLPEYKAPPGKPRAFKRITGKGSSTTKIVYKDDQVPPASDGWTEIPFDEATLGSNSHNSEMQKWPAKYRAYLEREKLKKENPGSVPAPPHDPLAKLKGVQLPPEMMAQMTALVQNARYGRKRSSGPGLNEEKTISLRIPLRPNDQTAAFYYKHTVGEFLRMHKGEGKERDQHALNTIELFCRHLAGSGPTAVDVCLAWKDVRAEEPIADLLYQMCESDLVYNEIDSEIYGPRFVKTTADLERLGYSPYLRLLGNVRAAKEILFIYEPDNPKRQAARKHIDRVEALLPEVLADRDLTAHAVYFALDEHIDNVEVVEAQPTTRIMKLFEQIEARRPELLPLIKGSYYVSYAWQARGRGFADTVTETGWKLMAERLAIARKNLEEAWRLEPSGYCAAKMISVCLGENKEKEHHVWFHRGVEVHPENTDLHFGRLQALCAKWGGSDEEMFEFARENVKRFQADPTRDYGNAMLICRAHEEAAPRDPHEREEYFKKREVYGEIRHTLATILTHRPKAVDVWSTLAFYALKAGDLQAAKHAFEEQGKLNFESTIKFGSIGRKQMAWDDLMRKLKTGVGK